LEPEKSRAARAGLLHATRSTQKLRAQFVQTEFKKRKPGKESSAKKEAPAKWRAAGASLLKRSSMEGDDPPLREPYYDFVARSVT